MLLSLGDDEDGIAIRVGIGVGAGVYTGIAAGVRVRDCFWIEMEDVVVCGGKT